MLMYQNIALFQEKYHPVQNEQLLINSWKLSNTNKALSRVRADKLQHQLTKMRTKYYELSTKFIILKESFQKCEESYNRTLYRSR